MSMKSIALGGVCLALACSRQESPRPSVSEQASKPAQAPTALGTAALSGQAEAKRIFKARCSVCHGESGTGNGPGAAALNPKPRNYTSAEWQKSVTDEEIAKIIVQGGAAVGKSAGMPNNPDLASKPEVVDALVKLVRSFGDQP